MENHERRSYEVVGTDTHLESAEIMENHERSSDEVVGTAAHLESTDEAGAAAAPSASALDGTEQNANFHNQTLEITESESLTSTERQSASFETPENQRINWFEASMHLIKGNLGPGCLNIPHAFVLSGWLLGCVLFIIVALQGIYSMFILTYCKSLLQEKRVHVHTFMDVAKAALGKKGQTVVQSFLFVLQAGVCCVFLSLITTNLKVQTGLSGNVCILFVTFALLGIVLLRFLKDLRWLSTTANVLMFLAITTSAIAGIIHALHPEADQSQHKVATSNAGDIATFVSSMFFSFEGIGLVLPVENCYTAAYASMEEELKANKRYRSRVLVGAMSTVAFLFLWIGVSASLGFPDITSGSITAYLEERFPDQPWFSVVNSLVMLAVFLTFPLQLTPAMEVLDDWFGPGCQPTCGCNWTVPFDTEARDGLVIERVDSSDRHREDALLEQADEDHILTTRPSCFGGNEWIFRRYLVVFGCAVIVLVVDDLGLLMSLFGAVGQTGLALMPCLIHYNLQKQGIAPKSKFLSVLDIFTIGFSFVVMISGLVFSVRRIVQEKLG